MSAGVHTEYVGHDMVPCRCILGEDHTRDQSEAFYGPDPLAHEFLPVLGHPDDDECTYREDGTDATYCGEPRDAHSTDHTNGSEG